jgi:hypothetical protein
MRKPVVRRRRGKAAEKPRSLDELLPTNLRLFAWSIPLVVAFVTIINGLTALAAAAQKEVRDRASTEIAFFDKRYEYARNLIAEQKSLRKPAEGGQADTASEADIEAERIFQSANTEANLLLTRPVPRLRKGWLDFGLGEEKQAAMAQVCGARKAAMDTFQLPAMGRGAEAYAKYLSTLKADTTAHDYKVYKQYEDACTPPAEEADGFDVAAAWAKLKNQVLFKQPVAQPAGLDDPNADDATVVKAATAKPGSASPGPEAPSESCSSPLPPGGQSVTAATKGSRDDGWDIDIFWCADSNRAQEEVNYKDACKVFNALSDDRLADESLGRRRLRRLPVALQDNWYYPRNGHTIRHDQGQIPELRLAQALQSKVGPEYQLVPSGSSSRWFLSVFVCPGTYKRAPGPPAA